MRVSLLEVLSFTIAVSALQAPSLPPLPSGRFSGLPVGPPIAPPDYMVDNQGNTFGAAPDKGSLDGPVISQANLSQLHGHETRSSSIYGPEPVKRDSDYWLADLASLGSMPFAASDYIVFRNVMDYGAVGDGVTDDTEAINLAASTGNRCGEECGSSSVAGAIVYFPSGTYLISSPIVQYYYTQFIGDVNDRPTILGSSNFTGIALIDNDVYIPDGDGNEWYINQNQFYRQIRNFILDLTQMSRTNTENDQEYVPTGIHWQVAQATSLQNIYFNMPVSDSSGATTAVGIFMENGSGGFVSDLEFFGGNIGFRAGSQQFTARNLSFTSCLTAISMIWDWGFTWQNINVLSCYIALDCSNFGGIDGQGTGSISVIDSTFNGVPYAITTHANGPTPNMILDNLLVENSASVVLVSGGATILEGSSGAVYLDSWGLGKRYTGIEEHGTNTTGLLDPAPIRPSSLIDSDDFVIVTDNGVSNDATGDQTNAINTILASSVGSPVFFPAGVYLVEGTVKVPVGSIIVGELWSQIMGTGSYFEDETNPQVMVQVGEAGDWGVVEISDMLFTVRGPTAGAILMEWNIHETTQGSAGMWDSHFRVGGAIGSNLQMSDCPKGASSVNTNCMAASLLLHVTSDSSGYFENVWAWVADHDLDEAPDGNTTTDEQIDIYSARGILIESSGPCWFYGTASEHSILYQYQISGASDIYLGHMQTESPYFQPSPEATQPYTIGTFSSDPTFDDCDAGSNCEEAWALRILNSSNVYIYSAGFYSFFSDYSQDCLVGETCQERIFQTDYSSSIWVYNIFTKGVVQIVSPEGGIPPVLLNDSNQSGYTSEVSAWLTLAEGGSTVGNSNNGSGVVYIGPEIWSEPNGSPTDVGCYPPCTLVIPPSSLGSTTVFTFPPYTTSVEVSWPIATSATVLSSGALTTTISGTTTVYPSGATENLPVYTTVTESTVYTIPPVTTDVVSFWQITIDASDTSSVIPLVSSILPSPFVVTDNSNPLSSGSTSISPSTRTITPPPSPYSTASGTSSSSQTSKTSKTLQNTTPGPSITYTSGAPSPTCSSGCGTLCTGPFCVAPCAWFTCLPNGDNGGGFEGGGGDPTSGGDNGDSGDDNNESSTACQTQTASACTTYCTAAASTCSVTCSTVIKCSATNTGTATTQTLADGTSITQEVWPTATDDDENTDAALTADESVLLSLYGATATVFFPDFGDATATSSGSASSTTATLIPSTTGTASGDPPSYWLVGYEVVASSESTADKQYRGFNVVIPAGDDWDPCDSDASWVEDDISDVDELPASLTAISVFDDTCNYIQTSSWEDASVYDTVGILQCSKYATAICSKRDNSLGCEIHVTEYMLAACYWSS